MEKEDIPNQESETNRVLTATGRTPTPITPEHQALLDIVIQSYSHGRSEIREWIQAAAEPVLMTPCAAVPDISGKLLDWMKKYRPNCANRNVYRSAACCARDVPGVSIIYGYGSLAVNAPTPLEWAWNEYGGHHFSVVSPDVISLQPGFVKTMRISAQDYFGIAPSQRSIAYGTHIHLARMFGTGTYSV